MVPPSLCYVSYSFRVLCFTIPLLLEPFFIPLDSHIVFLVCLSFTSCSRWHPAVAYGAGGSEKIECTNIIMADGASHVDGKKRCSLCGRKDKVKMPCSDDRCQTAKDKPWFHLSCARQAGLDVYDDEIDKEPIFHVKCFAHVRCDGVLRAKLEDLIELERSRAGPTLKNLKLPMSFVHASQLMHESVRILANIGWAWKWAEWWVEEGDNWEPLLEPGQNEKKMTKKELKIVDSTRESRCADARRCRLSVLGAALRNRDYDKEEGDDRITLCRALRAVLHTPSLVGPLQPLEIDFYVEWLSRAYRSKSPLLGFGDDKIAVSDEICKHLEDGSAKYELGNRKLPGKEDLPKGEVFETNFVDVDDYLRAPVTISAERNSRKRGRPKGLPSMSSSMSSSVKLNSTDASELEKTKESNVKQGTESPILSPPPKKKRRGRPPKKKPVSM